MMYQLGFVQFELMTLAPQTVTRSNKYRWASNNRMGGRPSKQFVGQGDDKITFDGVIFPEFSGSASLLEAILRPYIVYFPSLKSPAVGLWLIEVLRGLAAKGEPQPLMRGDGHYMGLYCVESVDETDTNLIAEGVPLKQEFKLELSHYGRDQYVRV